MSWRGCQSIARRDCSWVRIPPPPFQSGLERMTRHHPDPEASVRVNYAVAPGIISYVTPRLRTILSLTSAAQILWT